MHVEAEQSPQSLAVGGRQGEHAHAAPQVSEGVRALLKLATPLVISRAGLAMMGVIDAVMLAHLGSSHVAAMALAEGTFGRLLDVCVAAVASALVVFPFAWETGGADAQRALWQRLSVVALLLGVLIALAAPGSAFVLEALGQSGDIARDASAVISVLAFGLPAGLLAIATAVYLEATGRAPLVAVVLVLANLLNAAINWLLIFGHGGFEVMGAVGAATSTTLVRFLLAFAFLAIVVILEGPRAFRLVKRCGPALSRQAHVSGAAAATAGGMHALASTLTLMSGWLGTLAIASYASSWSITLPCMLLALGLGDAVASRAAQSKGVTLNRDLWTAASLLAPIAALIVAGAHAIAQAYTTDADLQRALSVLLPMAGIVLLLDGVSYTIVTSLRGLGDVKWPMAFQVGAMTLTPVLAWVFAHEFEMGAVGLLSAITLTSSLQCGLLLFRLSRLAPVMRHKGT